MKNVVVRPKENARSPANGIDCFKCVSMNGANKACDDPFHNNYSTAILESPCMGGRKGRDGLFPATSCIKIAGYYDDTGETITVRGCALDSGTLTTDTEIIRMSHCGRFFYDDRYVHGCLQSCNDADACNHSPRATGDPHRVQGLLQLAAASLVLGYVLLNRQHLLGVGS
ncbi:AAEL002484-PA [Aedes aegypti]|uniref:AAEL002484-PA n=1 Tax=Aedes aegypti TaxID=7159 RepID=Q17I18_AEDAE|nr:AAEL002484-PA [Aedes aegypti]